MNIVVSGPGGVGKGTLVDMLLERNPTIWLSRSWTTRERRPGEAEDAYVFASREEFDAKIAAGGFLEWVDFLDYRQGTPLPTPPAGADALFEIDVGGARSLRQHDPDVALVFVDAPDPNVQRQRLVRRGDPVDVVAARMAKGEQERAAARELGMQWIVNDDLDRAVEDLERVLEAHRNAIADRR